MKFKTKSAILIAAIFFALLAVAFALLSSPYTAYASSAESGGEYAVEELYCEYEVSENGLITAKEYVTINYSGAAHFVRHLNLKDVRANSVKTLALNDEKSAEVEYYAEPSGNQLIIITGGDSPKIGLYSYIIEYEYYAAGGDDGNLQFIAAEGWGAEIESATVKIYLPYSPDEKSFILTQNFQNCTTDFNENCVTVTYSGDFALSAKTLVKTTYGDNNYIYAIIATAVLAAIMLIVKLAFFNKNKVKAESAFHAIKDMDPLLMGKLVDNKAHDCDVAALIYYWANNGYVSLDLSDAQKPIITKLSNISAMAPDYEQKLFYGIFRRQNRVFLGSGDKMSYYKTSESVKKCVDERARGCYSGASMGVSLIFALLFALSLGVYPAFFGMFKVSKELSYLTGFLFSLPALIVYALAETLLYNRFKFSKLIKAAYSAAIICICGAMTALYAIFVPNFILELLPKIILSLAAYAGVICSAIIISRTREYNERLCEIVGVRKFILAATEPDMRDVMKDMPNLFFIVYPYAITLNLDGLWAQKFSNTKMKIPENYDFGNIAAEGSAGVYASLKTSCSKFISSLLAAPKENQHN